MITETCESTCPCFNYLIDERAFYCSLIGCQIKIGNKCMVDVER